MSKSLVRWAVVSAAMVMACAELPSQDPNDFGSGGSGVGAGSGGATAGMNASGSSGAAPVTGGNAGAAGSSTGGAGFAGTSAGTGGVTAGVGNAGSPSGGAPQAGVGGASAGAGSGGVATGGGGTGGGLGGAGTGNAGTGQAGTGNAGTGNGGMSGTGTAGTGTAGTASGGTSGAGAGAGGTSGGGTGGSGGMAGSCGRAVSACTAPVVTVTDVSVGVTVTGYGNGNGNESDTDPLPMAIAAKPSGGSRVAWLGTNGQVYIGELDCQDHLVGTPFTIPAIDLQDLYADDAGGVVLVTREATGSGTDHCGTGTLCGGTSSPCRAMWMVRFNASGQVQWETQVTNLSSSLDGYEDGARFIWWYQHHGRLAFDGTNYAAYFGVAITVNGANSCIDIHEGDRMQVVSGTGALIPNHTNAFEVGCSHAWTSRIVWDPRSMNFVMVCATDNSCRIARPDPYRTIATGTCDGTLFGGDLVLSSSTGYWTAWSQGGTIRLQHFTDSGPDTAIANAGSARNPHLVTYGTNRMLLAWASGSSMTAQIRDSGSSGATVGSTFTIGVNDHAYQAFKSYSDGSVAYPASGANNTSIRVARVMPCN